MSCSDCIGTCMLGSAEEVLPGLDRVVPLGGLVIAVVNSRSGSGLGHEVAAALHSIARVIMLPLPPPAEGSAEASSLAQLLQRETTAVSRNQLRLVVSGGDGTIAWALHSMAALLGGWATLPPLVLLPGGVGNELSRCLGWGAGPTSSAAAVATVVDCFSAHQSQAVDLDVWRVSLRGLTSSGADDDGADAGIVRGCDSDQTRPLVCFLSIGFDSAISHAFQEFRHSYPQALGGQIASKAAYAYFGASELFSGSVLLRRRLELVVDDVVVPIPDDACSLQCLNCHSSADGIDFFGTGQPSVAGELGDPRMPGRLQSPSLGDQLIDVVATRGVSDLIAIRLKQRHSHRLAQGRRVTIRALPALGKPPLTYQIDGESAVLQPGLTVDIGEACTVRAMIGPDVTRNIGVTSAI